MKILRFIDKCFYMLAQSMKHWSDWNWKHPQVYVANVLLFSVIFNIITILKTITGIGVVDDVSYWIYIASMAITYLFFQIRYTSKKYKELVDYYDEKFTEEQEKRWVSWIYFYCVMSFILMFFVIFYFQGSFDGFMINGQKRVTFPR